jgi:hypothetical protein
MRTSAKFFADCESTGDEGVGASLAVPRREAYNC